MHNFHSHYRLRRGSLIIEVVVATILFATALVALGRLARASTSLNVQSDQRLSAKLTAENAIVRLNGVDFDEVSKRSEAIENQMSEASGLSVEIETQPFSIQDTSALKLTVHVANESKLVNVTMHDWRVKQEEPTTEPDPATDPISETGGDDE